MSLGRNIMCERTLTSLVVYCINIKSRYNTEAVIWHNFERMILKGFFHYVRTSDCSFRTQPVLRSSKTSKEKSTLQMVAPKRSKSSICSLLNLGDNFEKRQNRTDNKLRSQTEASMSRPSQVESTYVQTVTDGSCLCPEFRAFTRLSCVNVQTFVRSSDFRAFMSRLSCVHQTFVRSTYFCAFMCRLLCIHVQTFERSTDLFSFTRF